MQYFENKFSISSNFPLICLMQLLFIKQYMSSVYKLILSTRKPYVFYKKPALAENGGPRKEKYLWILFVRYRLQWHFSCMHRLLVMTNKSMSKIGMRFKQDGLYRLSHQISKIEIRSEQVCGQKALSTRLDYGVRLEWDLSKLVFKLSIHKKYIRLEKVLGCSSVSTSKIEIRYKQVGAQTIQSQKQDQNKIWASRCSDCLTAKVSLK